VTDAYYITGFVIFGALLASWTLGRIFDGMREPLAIAGGLIVRIGLGVLLTLVAVDAARHGGFWWLLVPVVGVPALWNFALSAGIIWAWAREEPDASVG
jgi:uncharacterized membrane protein